MPSQIASDERLHAAVARRRLDLDQPLPLESGAILPAPYVAYECYGNLSPRKDNVVLVCHALSGDAHAAGVDEQDGGKPGWWDIAIGPGRMIDTDRWFVISTSVIGGGRGSSGPSSINPANGKPYGLSFPVITIGDMVNAQSRLMSTLGLEEIHAVIGGCLGGFQALQWGIFHGSRVRKVIAISVRPSTSAYTIALWEVIRRAIRTDPAWRNGDYYDSAPPTAGIGLAAAISLLHWLDPTTAEQKYGRKRLLDLPAGFSFSPEFLVEDLVDRLYKSAPSHFDANSFLYLTRAIDYFDLEAAGDLQETVRTAGGNYLLVSYERDSRYPAAEAQRLADALQGAGRPVTHAVLKSSFAHGAYQFDLSELEPLVRRHLTESSI